MLDETVKELATGTNFAVLSVHLPSGQILSQMMWVDATDDHVLINTEVGRTKYAAMQADPLVTVTIPDAGNPYHYAEVRGRVVGEVRGAEARAHIDALSERYTGAPYEFAIDTERVVVQIAPVRQRVQ